MDDFGDRESIGARECDFGELLATLHELVGSQVCMLVMSVSEEDIHLVASHSGRLEGGCELDEGTDAPLAFRVGGLVTVVSEATLASARREERVDRDGQRWLVVSIQYLGGATVEISELPKHC